MTAENHRKRLAAIHRAAVAAVDPEARVRAHLEPTRQGARVIERERAVAEIARDRVRIIAVGKAAMAMARGASAALGGAIRGIVVAPSGGGRLPRSLVRLRGEHPLPGRGSLAAGRAVWGELGGLARDEMVLVLLSGGASSLLALPAPGVTLEDKLATTKLLLRAGATIAETNAVRKHLSRLKGGGLARRAAPASVVTLLLSDVIGDSPAVIGSGPTAPDPTTFADVWAVLERYDLVERVPARVRRRIERGRRGGVEETVKPGEIRTRAIVVGNVASALEGAAREARRLGFEPRVWTERLRGEARRAATRVAREIERVGRVRKPICLLAGGETIVRVGGDGRGGRNQELALALAEKIAGRNVAALAAGTDGIDGPTDAAGAFVDGETVARARCRGLEPRGFLRRNDSHGFFSKMGDLHRPGPTGTNVMDVTIVLVGARA
jgi:glycerate 2-kinase